MDTKNTKNTHEVAKDASLLDRSVRIFSDADGLVSGMQIGDICIGTIQRLPNDIAHKTLSEDHHSANTTITNPSQKKS